MKKLTIPFSFLLLTSVALTGCKPVPAADEDGAVAFEVARNYFFKNNQPIPANAKISTQEQFSQLFGMATTMGPEGKPTPIDFTKQFVLAVVLPPSDIAMDIQPVQVKAQGDTLFYTYDVSLGERQSFQSQPLSIIILDRDLESKHVVLVCDKDATREQAIDRYLVEQIGSRYAQGQYCVPAYSIVATADSDTADILVWGDFWVYHFNQEADTLKCVSGGSHPGLMHLCQSAKGFEVTAFDQVADGSGYQPSAQRIFGDHYNAFQAINSDEQSREQVLADRLSDYADRHGLTAHYYQHYGWPAKSFKEPQAEN